MKSFQSLKLCVIFLIFSSLETQVAAFEYGRIEKHPITGAEFREVKTHPSLGEAWEDPSGMVWAEIGPYVTRADCSSMTSFATRSNFFDICRDLGMTTPGMADYELLAKFMGKDRNQYAPRILKGMNQVCHCSEGAVFDGRNGTIAILQRPFIGDTLGHARCSVERSKLPEIEKMLYKRDNETRKRASEEKVKKGS